MYFNIFPVFFSESGKNKKKKKVDGPKVPPADPPTFILKPQDHAEAVQIREGHQDRPREMVDYNRK